MSKYTLRVKEDKNIRNDFNSVAEILKGGDYISVFTDKDSYISGVINAIEEQNLSYKYVEEGDNRYILAKKEKNELL